MDPFTLEITVNRVGGAEDYHGRVWGPWCAPMVPGSSSVSIPSRTGGNAWITAQFDRWAIVRPGLLSASLHLVGMDGQSLSPARPVLFCSLPCDVPLFSSHLGRLPDWGLFSVGLRSPREVWAPEDAAEVAEAPVAA